MQLLIIIKGNASKEMNGIQQNKNLFKSTSFFFKLYLLCIFLHDRLLHDLFILNVQGLKSTAVIK